MSNKILVIRDFPSDVRIKQWSKLKSGVSLLIQKENSTFSVFFYEKKKKISLPESA